MKPIKVKTLFQGKVGIRDRYINEAIKKKEGLEIQHNSEVMTIPYQDLQRKIVGKSEKPFQDRFTEKFHFLFYYSWKPKVSQKKLL